LGDYVESLSAVLDPRTRNLDSHALDRFGRRHSGPGDKGPTELPHAQVSHFRQPLNRQWFRLGAKRQWVVARRPSGSAGAATKLVEEIESAGGRATAVQADVSDPTAVRRLFDAAENEFGGVDILVNNAGITKLARFTEVDDTTFDQTIAISLKGVFNGLREAARRLRDGGRIVNFSSSVVGLYQPAYGI